MTDIYYPHDSLPMPLQEGYGFQPVSPLKTNPVNHRSREAKASFYVHADTGQHHLVMETDAQGLAFESWFRDALSDGAAWFMMKLQTPAGIKFYKCRFTDIYQGPVLVARFTGSTRRRLNYGNAPLLLPHGVITRNGSSAAHCWILR
ncbi:alkanesulfonate ABC transporter permease [Klebsiella variicola]|nr:alkanesulfonate ABC transporter permease [Klebsiella variicola]